MKNQSLVTNSKEYTDKDKFSANVKPRKVQQCHEQGKPHGEKPYSQLNVIHN